MEGNFILDNDTDLHLLLTQLLPLASTMEVASRAFCELDVDVYYGTIAEELGGNGTTCYSDLLKAFYEDESVVYILVGEHTDNYGSGKSGSRNLSTNAMNAEEIQAWIDYFGVEKFHVDYPRIETIEE